MYIYLYFYIYSYISSRGSPAFSELNQSVNQPHLSRATAPPSTTPSKAAEGEEASSGLHGMAKPAPYPFFPVFGAVSFKERWFKTSL